MTIEQIAAEFGRYAPHTVPAQMKWARGIVEEAIDVARNMPDGHAVGRFYDISDNAFDVHCLIAGSDVWLWFEGEPHNLYSPHKMAGMIQKRVNRLELPSIDIGRQPALYPGAGESEVA